MAVTFLTRVIPAFLSLSAPSLPPTPPPARTLFPSQCPSHTLPWIPNLGRQTGFRSMENFLLEIRTLKISYPSGKSRSTHLSLHLWQPFRVACKVLSTTHSFIPGQQLPVFTCGYGLTFNYSYLDSYVQFILKHGCVCVCAHTYTRTFFGVLNKKVKR